MEDFHEQGEKQPRTLDPSQADPRPDAPQVARVLHDRVRLERTRPFGPCRLGLPLWKRLELDRCFEEAVEERVAGVPWPRGVALLALHRLCAPGGEGAAEQRRYPPAAPGDGLGIAEGQSNDTRLSRCLDRMLPQKTKRERHRKQR
jgi:hypothetical protein